MLKEGAGLKEVEEGHRLEQLEKHLMESEEGEGLMDSDSEKPNRNL